MRKPLLLLPVENYGRLSTMTDISWRSVIKSLEEEMSKPNFATWVKNINLEGVVENCATVSVPNEYAKAWLQKNLNKRLLDLLTTQDSSINSINYMVKSVSKNNENGHDLPIIQFSEKHSEVSDKPVEQKSTNYFDQFSFNSFIVGNNNRLAFAAAQVVADKPGETYNPLFLYGGVGLGKTHLMQAIGNEIRRRYPEKKILYTSCEAFASEFIFALKDKTIDEFKKKYRSIDVLLVDDIQFLANKEGTQEEFFHTFNMLHQHRKQIILTADRMPRDIQDLEDRLTSRFGWGMVADIQPPNYETRVAILRAKAQEKNLDISDDVYDYIANTITTNVRELEGSLLKLAANASLEGISITKELAQRALKDITKGKSNPGTGKQVIQAVAKYFDLDTLDLLGKRRTKELVYPRQLVMYILHEQNNMSYPQIGDLLGGKDHTTVMYGVDKVTKAKKTNISVENDIKEVLEILK